MMRLLVFACLGGAVGSGARHLVNVWAARLLGTGLPWGTLTVNILGSFVMGVVIETLAARFSGSMELRTLIATGILGGFTTFSAFSLEVVTLMERGETAVAVGYAAVSVGASIVALVAGLTLARLVLA